MTTRADRPRQLAAVHAAADLIARDLPVASWSISAHATGLTAQIHRDDDREVRNGVAAWSGFFGTAVQVTERKDSTDHTVTAEHMGVPVRVWGYTDCTFTYEKVPAGEAS